MRATLLLALAVVIAAALGCDSARPLFLTPTPTAKPGPGISASPDGMTEDEQARIEELTWGRIKGRYAGGGNGGG